MIHSFWATNARLVGHQQLELHLHSQANTLITFKAILFYTHILPPWRWLLQVPPKHWHQSKDVITVMPLTNHDVRKNNYIWLSGKLPVCGIRQSCSYACSGNGGTAPHIPSLDTTCDLVFSFDVGQLYRRNKSLNNKHKTEWNTHGIRTTSCAWFSSYLSHFG